MVQSAETFLSPEEYLAWEEDQEEKHEYFNGRIYAMSGGSLEHATILQNLSLAFGNRMRGRSCRVFTSELRVQVRETGLYTYPDFTVVCGEMQLDRTTKSVTLLNPTLIVEVLSPSTEAYDRGEKFAHYRRLTSLTDYVLISTKSPLVEHFRRNGEDWNLSLRSGLESNLELGTLGIELPLNEIYELVEFPLVPTLISHSSAPEDV